MSREIQAARSLLYVSHALFCSNAFPLLYSTIQHNQKFAQSARRRKSGHLANIQLVGTNAVSGTMFLVMRRKIEIHISRFSPPPLPASPLSLSRAHRINNYFFFITVSDEEWKSAFFFLLARKWK